MPDVNETVAVAFDRPADRKAAEALGERLQLPIAKRFRDPHALHLAVSEPNRIELRVVAADHPLHGGHPVAVELLKLDTASPAGRKLNTPLFKAVGVRKGNPFRPRVLDATAGLGEDAWLLATTGCDVLALERHPVIHALLENGLRRAAEAQPEIATRIELLHNNAAGHLASPNPEPQTSNPDVVYLDPMFPLGRKTAERKPMRVLRMLAGDDPDADALLEPALQRAARRVVVKRPRHAPPLAGREPTVTHAGKALRFDVYATG